MNKVFKTLEFDKIKEQILKYNQNELSKKRVLKLKPFYYFEQVNEELKKTEEGYQLKNNGNFPSLAQVIDLENYLNILEKNGVLNLKEIYDFYQQLLIIHDLKKFRKEQNLDLFYFNNLVDQLYYINEIVDKIKNSIDINYRLFDNASIKLKNIRQEITSLESDIKNRLNSYLKNHSEYLAECLIVSRGNHLVLPVKATYKNSIKGIVVDVSDSGQTYYIEPYSVVELSVKIENLKYEEIIEENRIIKALCLIINKYNCQLKSNNELIEEISFMYLKGDYGINENLEIAKLSKFSEIKLIKAIHPLIDKDKVIANDFLLGNNQKNILIISGPNAGGKTVALKTVALLVLLNQCGLPISASEAILGVFKNIFVDIGDDQSIENSLSGFSSHIYNLKGIIDNLDDKTFVALDELGSKTDPLEGEALAKAIIDYIGEKKSLAMISTHYLGIKDFAKESDNIVLSSMSFDKNTLTPTYHLLLNVVGRSYALEISSRMGLNKKIINKAYEYKKINNYDFEKLTDELSEKLLIEKNKINLLEEKEKKLNEKEQLLMKKQVELEEKKKSLLEEVEYEKEALIENAEAEIKQIVDEFKNKSVIKLHEKNETLQKIKKLKKIDSVLDNIHEVDENISENDDVMIKSLNKIGKVLKIKGNNLKVLVSDKEINLKLNDVKKVSINKNQEKVKSTKGVKVINFEKNVATSINVVGKHVDEALEEISRYLDDALLVHYKSVSIIHGTGTGTLKKAIWEYLKRQKYVDSFRSGVYGEGGIGVTVVNLK